MLMIAVGLVKKLLIADYLANNLVGRILTRRLFIRAWKRWSEVYGYALQLFFDFSGYTDIAISAALLLGIQLQVNFRQPYLVCERGRVSGGAGTSRFSEWLRGDYLFDVLPKRRKHPVLSYGYAFLVTFTLGGLWRGNLLDLPDLGRLARAGTWRGLCVEAHPQICPRTSGGPSCWAAW